MDAPLSKQPFFQIQGTKGELVLEGSFEGGIKMITAEREFTSTPRHTSIPRHITGRLLVAVDPEGVVVDSDLTGQGRPGGFLHSYEPQLVDFGRAALFGEALAAGAEVAMGEVAVITAMYRSGKRETWEDIWGLEAGEGGGGAQMQSRQ